MKLGKGRTERGLIEAKFWTSGRHRKVFQLFSDGKNVQEVAAELNMGEATVGRVISNPIFIYRLRDLLNARLYELQLKKVADVPMVYSKLRDAVFSQFDKINPNLLFTHYMKMIPKNRQGEKQ